MKKIYMTPDLKIAEIEAALIIAGSLDEDPTEGLGENKPTNGGSGDEGSGFAGAKGEAGWASGW